MRERATSADWYHVTQEPKEVWCRVLDVMMALTLSPVLALGCLLVKVNSGGGSCCVSRAWTNFHGR